MCSLRYIILNSLAVYCLYLQHSLEREHRERLKWLAGT